MATVKWKWFEKSEEPKLNRLSFLKFKEDAPEITPPAVTPKVTPEPVIDKPKITQPIKATQPTTGMSASAELLRKIRGGNPTEGLKGLVPDFKTPAVTPTKLTAKTPVGDNWFSGATKWRGGLGEDNTKLLGELKAHPTHTSFKDSPLFNKVKEKFYGGQEPDEDTLRKDFNFNRGRWHENGASYNSVEGGLNKATKREHKNDINLHFRVPELSDKVKHEVDSFKNPNEFAKAVQAGEVSKDLRKFFENHNFLDDQGRLTSFVKNFKGDHRDLVDTLNRAGMDVDKYDLKPEELHETIDHAISNGLIDNEDLERLGYEYKNKKYQQSKDNQYSQLNEDKLAKWFHNPTSSNLKNEDELLSDVFKDPKQQAQYIQAHPEWMNKMLPELEEGEQGKAKNLLEKNPKKFFNEYIGDLSDPENEHGIPRTLAMYDLIQSQVKPVGSVSKETARQVEGGEDLEKALDIKDSSKYNEVSKKFRDEQKNLYDKMKNEYSQDLPKVEEGKEYTIGHKTYKVTGKSDDGILTLKDNLGKERQVHETRFAMDLKHLPKSTNEAPGALKQLYQGNYHDKDLMNKVWNMDYNKFKDMGYSPEETSKLLNYTLYKGGTSTSPEEQELHGQIKEAAKGGNEKKVFELIDKHHKDYESKILKNIANSRNKITKSTEGENEKVEKLKQDISDNKYEDTQVKKALANTKNLKSDIMREAADNIKSVNPTLSKKLHGQATKQEAQNFIDSSQNDIENIKHRLANEFIKKNMTDEQKQKYATDALSRGTSIAADARNLAENYEYDSKDPDNTQAKKFYDYLHKKDDSGSNRLNQEFEKHREGKWNEILKNAKDTDTMEALHSFHDDHGMSLSTKNLPKEEENVSEYPTWDEVDKGEQSMEGRNRGKYLRNMVLNDIGKIPVVSKDEYNSLIEKGKHGFAEELGEPLPSEISPNSVLKHGFGNLNYRTREKMFSSRLEGMMDKVNPTDDINTRASKFLGKTHSVDKGDDIQEDFDDTTSGGNYEKEMMGSPNEESDDSGQSGSVQKVWGKDKKRAPAKELKDELDKTPAARKGEGLYIDDIIKNMGHDPKHDYVKAKLMESLFTLAKQGLVKMGVSGEGNQANKPFAYLSKSWGKFMKSFKQKEMRIVWRPI